MQTNDLKELNKFLDKEVKWYWYLPIVGYFIFTAKSNKFLKENKMIITSGNEANSKFQYVQVGQQLMYRSYGVDEIMRKIMNVHTYTLMISFFVLLIFEIAVFNIAPILLRAMSNKTIKKYQ